MFPLVASAQTAGSTADLQAVIKQLQTQIQLLQAQVADLQAQVQSVKTELKFSRVLAKGVAGDDVKQLQEFLKTFPDVYPEGLVTGYFGPLTEAAIKKFQEHNGIESVGIVGPKTQAKLTELATAGAGQSGVIPSGLASGVTPPSVIVPATPATPAIPAIPATSSTPAMPAISATPATPASPGGSSPPTPPPSPTPPPATSTDTTAPSAPINLSATAISSSQINISWMSSTDNIGVVGYKVYRGSVQIGTIAASVASTTFPYFYSDTGLQASTAYAYTVAAYDAAGNDGVQSTGASATTKPPEGPITVTSPNGGSVWDVYHYNQGIYWKLNGVSRVGFKLLKGSQVVYSNSSPITSNSTNLSISPTFDGVASTYYTSVGSGSDYKIRVFDWDHPEIYDDSDNYFTIPLPDILPPVVSLVSASSITSNSAIITWTTDEPATGFVNYGSTSNNWVVTPTITSYSTSHSFTLSNLASNTLYTYRVYSVDLVSNGPQGYPPEHTFTTLSGPVSCSGIDLTLNDGKTTYIKGVDNLVNFTWTCTPGGSANVSIVLQKPGSLGQEPRMTISSSAQTSSIDISGSSYPAGTYDLIACFNVCGSIVAERIFNIQ